MHRFSHRDIFQISQLNLRQTIVSLNRMLVGEVPRCSSRYSSPVKKDGLTSVSSSFLIKSETVVWLDLGMPSRSVILAPFRSSQTEGRLPVAKSICQETHVGNSLFFDRIIMFSAMDNKVH